MGIAISRALHAELRALAAATPEREVCGLLLGEDGRVTAIQPCANVAPSPADSFEIDPAALIAAHKSARAGGPPLIGSYHSHPNGKPEPSARDMAGADPALPLMLIIAAGEVLGWMAGEGGMSAVELVVGYVWR
jgi:desampylase